MELVLSRATPIGQYKMQTANCRLGTKHRLGIKTFARLICDNMSSENILSVT